METKTNNADAVTLWGREFRRTKNGLDEEQVASFVNELITERDVLKKYQENLSSLTKLAEKTVDRGDELARQAKQEALEQAKVEAEELIAKAKEEGKKIIEEKKAEAVTSANTEAERIKSEAQKQAAQLLSEKAQEIAPMMRERGQRIYQEVQSQLEDLKQRVKDYEAEFALKLSRLSQENTTEGEPKDSQSSPPTTNEVKPAAPEWELHVLPPLDVMQTLQIVTYLDNLPEVKNTELIPQVDQAMIMVFLNKPVELIEKLRALPQIADVKEKTPNGADKPRNLQIVLAGKASLRSSDHSQSF